MKFTAFVAILAILFVASQALDNDPIDVIPYCRLVEAGYSTDTYGDVYPTTPTSCVISVSFAIFLNGQDTGYDLAAAVEDFEANGFWDINGANNSINPIPPYGVVWDLGAADCVVGTGIGDGTYDTVDGAMAILFDSKGYGMASSGDPFNISSTCSSTSVSIIVADLIPSGLVNRRTFYFPTAASESWGRVVDEVINPTDSPIEVSIAYYNNVGSDEDTVFQALSDRYSFSSEKPVPILENDNLVSLHWSSIDGVNPDGFILVNDQPVPIPFSYGVDDIVPYWNVTIPAGETMTFMFIMNQGGLDLAMMNESVLAIDANPIKLYAEMTTAQLSTLYNFNACNGPEIPQLTDTTPTTACTENGGKAVFDLSSYLAFAPFEIISVTAHDVSTDAVVATSTGTSISIPAGTFNVKLNYGKCAVSVGEVTVACSEAPVAGPGSGSAPAAGPTTVPSGKTSASQILLGFGASSLMTLVALF